MKIIYTKHLKKRLKLRKFPDDYPKLILNNPEQRFFDNLENREIAIKRLKYNNKLRNVMIAYDIRDDKIEIVTIHPIRNDQILNRTNSGRWSKK